MSTALIDIKNFIRQKEEELRGIRERMIAIESQIIGLKMAKDILEKYEPK